MLIEFDAAKQERNLRTRGIGLDQFADIEWDTAIAVEDTRQNYGEQRLRVLGFIEDRLHTAVITPRGEKIRVISLRRRANRREERIYEEARQSSD